MTGSKSSLRIELEKLISDRDAVKKLIERERDPVVLHELSNILTPLLHHIFHVTKEIDEIERKNQELLAEGPRLYDVYIYSKVFDHWIIKTQGKCFDLVVDKETNEIKIRKLDKSSKPASVYRGLTFLDTEDIYYKANMVREMRYPTYDLLFRNCQTFAEDLLDEILYKHPRQDLSGSGIGRGGSELNTKENAIIYDRLGGFSIGTRTLSYAVVILVLSVVVYKVC